MTFTSKIEAAGMGAVGIVTTEAQPGRIPYRDIRGWANDYGIMGSAFDVFRALVEAVDDEYIVIDAEMARERAARRS